MNITPVFLEIVCLYESLISRYDELSVVWGYQRCRIL